MITPKENNSGKHGHWERINIFFSLMGIYRCSLCKGATEPTAFCSMCGGQMDEAEKKRK